MEIAFEEPPCDGDFGELDLRTYRDKDHNTVIAALNDAFSEDPFWQEVTPARFRERFLGRHERCGSWPGTGTSSVSASRREP